jgi:hypothetical protein
MPRVGLEPTIPVSESRKTLHALDHVATMITSYRNPKLLAHSVYVMADDTFWVAFVHIC